MLVVPVDGHRQSDALGRLADRGRITASRRRRGRHARSEVCIDRGARVSRAAVRDRLLRRPHRHGLAQRHRGAGDLRAVAGDLLHLLDLLRQRRARRPQPASTSCPSISGRSLVMLLRLRRAAQDPAHRQGASNITSIADFVAARYGKSQLLAGLVTVIAVVGVLPYIALQLKAVARQLRRAARRAGAARPRRRRVRSWQRHGAATSPCCMAAVHHPVRHAPCRCHRAPSRA